MGFVFLKKFDKAGLYTGRVLQILNNGKRMCQFCDGERYAYTLAQLENYSKTKNQLRKNYSDDSDSDFDVDDGMENEDNDVVDCNTETSNASDEDIAAETILLENNSSNGVDSNAAAVVNGTTLPATRPSVPKTSSKLAILSKKFVNTLTTIPLGATPESHLCGLKER